MPGFSRRWLIALRDDRDIMLTNPWFIKSRQPKRKAMGCCQNDHDEVPNRLDRPEHAMNNSG